MRSILKRWLIAFTVLLLTAGIARAADPLLSWNEGSTKTAIVEFVITIQVIKARHLNISFLVSGSSFGR